MELRVHRLAVDLKYKYMQPCGFSLFQPFLMRIPAGAGTAPHHLCQEVRCRKRIKHELQSCTLSKEFQFEILVIAPCLPYCRLLRGARGTAVEAQYHDVAAGIRQGNFEGPQSFSCASSFDMFGLVSL